MIPQSGDGRIFLTSLSTLLGLTYFTSWSLSFYPQLLLNHRLHTATGMTIDFPITNLLGFTFYSIYTACFLFSDTIKRQYAERHPEALVSTVTWADLAFAVHAWCILVGTLGQYWVYGTAPSSFKAAISAADEGADSSSAVHGAIKVGGDEAAEARRPSAIILGICAITLLAALIATALAAAGEMHWLDVLYVMSTLKLFLTLVKYTPQVLLNYHRRSTIGFSIYTILFDAIGGVASISQLLLDSWMMDGDSGTGVKGNAVKLLLGVYSLGFDGVFALQHFVLYRGRGESDGKDRVEEEADGERRPLLDAG